MKMIKENFMILLTLVLLGLGFAAIIKADDDRVSCKDLQRRLGINTTYFKGKCYTVVDGELKEIKG